MPPSRSLSALAAIAILCVLGPGCGDDSAETSSIPEEALAKVRASDYARAVNLHASDLPYFEPIPDDEEEDPAEERERERRLKRCLGDVEDFDDPLAEVSSPTYGADVAEGLLRVQSAVSVTADAAEAGREMRLLSSDRAAGCFRRVYVAALEDVESSGAEVRNASVRRISAPAPELEDTFGYRFIAKVMLHGDTAELTAYRPGEPVAESLTVPVYVDIVGFLAGRAAITLTATGAPSPVSRNLERNLLRTLHERALERRLRIVEGS